MVKSVLCTSRGHYDCDVKVKHQTKNCKLTPHQAVWKIQAAHSERSSPNFVVCDGAGLFFFSSCKLLVLETQGNEIEVWSFSGGCPQEKHQREHANSKIKSHTQKEKKAHTDLMSKYFISNKTSASRRSFLIL